MDNDNFMKKGFTLIEILVVIAIIGILASIVLVGLGGFRARGQDARRIADTRQVQNALELYYNKCGYYPGGATAGTCNTTNPSTWADLQNTLVNAQIGVTSVSNDPIPGQNYVYGVASNRQNYVVGATLGDANDASLRQDVDGTVNGVDCADPVYCVQL